MTDVNLNLTNTKSDDVQQDALEGADATATVSQPDLLAESNDALPVLKNKAENKKSKTTKMTLPTVEVACVASPVGATVFMRSGLWQNGRSTIVGIVTAVQEAEEIELAGADFIVSVTAFPPGLPAKPRERVPFYNDDPGSSVMPAAWLKK